jgi:ABC-type sugar transport system substrate-binding protein
MVRSTTRVTDRVGVRGGRRIAGLAVALTSTLALAGWFGVGTSAATTSPTTAHAAAAIPAYNGPEKRYFGTVSAPTKPKKGLKVGFLQVFGGQPILVAMQDSFVAEIKKLGGSTVVYDAGLNPQTQVSQFNLLFAQGVKGIGVMPVDAAGIQPSLQQAKKSKIPVVGFNDPVDLSTPANPLLTSTINAGYDYGAYLTMKAIAQKAPGSGFAILGTSLPITTLQYADAREKYWGVKLGLKFLGEQDAQEDTPTGYAPAAQGILTDYPSVKSIITYNDESALAVSTAAAQAGKSGINIADPNSGQTVAGAAIKSGAILGGYFVPYVQIGKMMADAVYAAASGDAHGLPKIVVTKSKFVSKANVGKFKFVG